MEQYFLSAKALDERRHFSDRIFAEYKFRRRVKFEIIHIVFSFYGLYNYAKVMIKPSFDAAGGCFRMLFLEKALPVDEKQRPEGARDVSPKKVYHSNYYYVIR
jgi:hypothetical protein